MAKLALSEFDAETAFTLLYTALLPLGHRLSSTDLGTGIQQVFIHNMMKIMVDYTGPMPFLQINSMNDNPILKLWFEGFYIHTKLLRSREKRGMWQVPLDKSVIDAEVLMIQMAATINQYVQYHYKLCLIQSAEDITKLSQQAEE